MKTYSESRIELRNLQILKKMLENQVSFCHRSSPGSVALKITGVEKMPSENGQPRGHLIRVLNERSVNDGRDIFFCGW